ncbi:rod shape-determining protein MreD [Candidatus Parcubacteria bacterium]|nr:rod shape-determining protein MreD [Patescibacteria group bacterium]MBU4467084.1 rod shape-determining protein MreD [Patescibacteria group bacterium]MCG2688779.1 rod shape-determining protein MreD [Candidatus Parcubacteria bacterium]
MKKIFISIGIIYLLIIFQTSFLAHFRSYYYLPSLAIIFVVFLNLFEKQEEKNGLIIAGACGFFLDIFSGKPLGFYTVILLIASLVIKVIVKKYLYLKPSK